MRFTLRNDVLTVEVEDTGAQLSSIRDTNGTEYLWQGDPAIWPRRAPLLFPIIARLKDGQYTLDGQTFHISNHGFCRDAPFTAQQDGDDRISFRLTDSAETREAYPFSFVLTVTYTLSGNRLTKSHRIENHSKVPMYYELGGHDGYRAPLSDGEKMDDYAIRIPNVNAIQPYGMDADNMITPKGRAFPLEKGRIPLKPSTFALDTIILDELSQSKAALVDGQNRTRVAVSFEGFPYLGIWTANKPFDTNYVCIEPWTSLPDATFVGRALTDKKGIRTLSPDAQEELSYSVEFFPL